MEKMEIIGLVGILVLVVAMSGCTNYELLTYSDGVISFDYPDTFKNAPSPENITNGSTDWEEIAYLKNDNDVRIQVAKNPKIWSNYEAKTANEQSIKETGEVIESTDDINDNAVYMDILVYTFDDPDGRGKILYYEMYFSGNKTVYIVTVYGLESKRDEIYAVADTISDSIDNGGNE